MNITLIQDQIAYIELTLETEDEFEVYGGTTRAPFEFQPTGVAAWRVVVRESEVAGSAIRAFDIYARQRSTGREWVVLSGRIMVKPRTADIEGDKLSPVEYHVTVPVVDSVLETQGMAIVTGIPGPQGPKGEKGEPGDGNVTAEAIQAVVPIAWNMGTVAYDPKPTTKKEWSIAFGSFAQADERHTISLGHFARSLGFETVCIGADSWTRKNSSISIGNRADSFADTNITIGAQYTEAVNGQNVTNYCQTQGTGSITIGAGANTLNNGTTESSNSVTIGCKALNQGADSVVIGAQAKGTVAGGVAVGTLAESVNYGVSLGREAKALGNFSLSIGGSAKTQAFYSAAICAHSFASAEHAHAIGYLAKAMAKKTVSLGYNAQVSDIGATVIRSTASDGTYTQLYFSGANTPLANTYHGGAPMLGYVTKDSAGNIVAAGTRSLIELLTDNSTFAPASLDENGEWVMPKVFHPSDLDMPQEEPSEVEEYQPLPVYPIVEPEVDELRTPTQEI